MNSRARYIFIAERNDRIGTFHGTEEKLDLAVAHGLSLECNNWRDHHTNAYGRTWVARRKHFKKLPKAIRRALESSR